MGKQPIIFQYVNECRGLQRGMRGGQSSFTMQISAWGCIVIKRSACSAGSTEEYMGAEGSRGVECIE